MAIPNGSGSEVLRNFGIYHNSSATALVDFGGTTGTGTVRTSGNTSGVINVPANVIITVLNITYSAYGANTQVNAAVDWQGGGTVIPVFKHLNLADNTTFVYNDKIVLREGDELQLYSQGGCDIYGHFIYQDWTTP